MMSVAELDRMDQLIPEARWRAYRVMEAMLARGYPLYVGRTLGTRADTAAAVAAGHASATMTHDWHELGRAVDFRLRLPNGEPSWDTSPDSWPFWKALYEEATKMGMRCLGYRPDGTRLLIKTTHGLTWDPGHAELRTPYATLAEAIAKELASPSVA